MAWILSSAFVKACESWHYSQEPGGVSSEVNCSDGEPSAQSKLNHTVKPSLHKDRMKDSLNLSRSGMMFAVFEAQTGEDVLTSYREAFRVRTSQQLTQKLKELQDQKAGSGNKCSESFARYSHNSHSWRTPLFLLKEDYPLYLETWPKAGMMRNGMCAERTPLEQTMNVKECGSLREKFPTPMAHDGSGRDAVKVSVVKRDNPLLETMVAFFPTPKSHDAKDTNAPSEMKRNSLALANVAKIFPGDNPGDNPGDKLIQIAKERMLKAGQTGSDTLFLAHTAKEITALSPWNLLKKFRDLGYITAEEMSAESSKVGGKLNPEFAEWLMGWPIGWTGLEPLETVKYQQ